MAQLETPSNTATTPSHSLSEMKGVYISTYGCQMNVNDTERMYSLLEMSNFTPVQTPEEASIIIINACSVREKPVHKVYSEVGTYKKLKAANADLKIGVAGCVGQQEKENLIKKQPMIDFVFGTDNIDELPQIVSRLYADQPEKRVVQARFKHGEPYHVETLVRNPGVSTFVNIAKGCDNFCSFCIVPFTRGRERSRPAEHILADVRGLVKRGVKEVTLLGQNVNSYNDAEVDFADLLKRVAVETDIRRIRYTTSHPKDFNQKLVDIMQEHREKICDYIHLPFQSGSTPVLARMNRGYSREEYLRKVEMIKKAIPGVALSTDIIVGFPGETEEDFQQTVAMVEEVGYESIFAFKYSPRPFTKAAKFEDQLPDDQKQDRLARLFAAQDKIGFEIAKRYQDQVFEVLMEENNSGIAFGRTTQNKTVHFPLNSDSFKPGDLVQVRIDRALPNVLHGVIQQ